MFGRFGDAILILALVVILNGAVGYFFRYNFVTLQRYGPSLVPIYISAGGVAIGVIGLALKTIHSGRSSRENSSD